MSSLLVTDVMYKKPLPKNQYFTEFKKALVSTTFPKIHVGYFTVFYSQ